MRGREPCYSHRRVGAGSATRRPPSCRCRSGRWQERLARPEPPGWPAPGSASVSCVRARPAHVAGSRPGRVRKTVAWSHCSLPPGAARLSGRLVSGAYAGRGSDRNGWSCMFPGLMPRKHVASRARKMNYGSYMRSRSANVNARAPSGPWGACALWAWRPAPCISGRAGRREGRGGRAGRSGQAAPSGAHAAQGAPGPAGSACGSAGAARWRARATASS